MNTCIFDTRIVRQKRMNTLAFACLSGAGRRMIIASLWIAIVLVMAPIPSFAQSATDEEPLAPSLYPPVDVPEWTPPVNDLFHADGAFAVYDVATGEESMETVLIDDLALAVEEAQSIGGLLDEGSVATAVADGEAIMAPDQFSALTLVSAPEVYPWRPNVRLFITWQNGSMGTCSGVLIEPKWVLTAGHCVHQGAGGNWAKSIRVVPAYHDGKEPYSYAYSERVYSHTGWTQSTDFNFDMGMIRLEWPIGANVGWHGYGYNNNNSFFLNSSFYSPGYPAENPYNGEKMYFWSGKYDSVDQYIVRQTRTGYRGQSGSGSYAMSSTNARVVYATHSHRTARGETGMTRLTKWWFDYITTSIAQNTPTRVDLMPLSLSTSSQKVTAGNTVPQIDVFLHNYSSAAMNGNVSVQFYLSRDRNVAPSDILLGTRSFPLSLTAKRATTVHAQGLAIPETANGAYWLGVIITTADANAANNTLMSRLTVPITVDPLILPPPSGVNVEVRSQEIILRWTPVNRAVSYRVWRTAPGQQAESLGTTQSTNFTDASAVWGVTYTYSVQSMSPSGIASSMSGPITAALKVYRVFMPLVVH